VRLTPGFETEGYGFGGLSQAGGQPTIPLRGGVVGARERTIGVVRSARGRRRDIEERARMKAKSIKKHALLFIVLLTLVVASVGASASSARAATGWVYICWPTWQGNPGGVNLIQAYSPLWSTTGDAGDDIVYARVTLNANNQVIYQLFHTTSYGTFRIGMGSNTVRPTRSNQCWYIGPSGVTHN